MSRSEFTANFQLQTPVRVRTIKACKPEKTIHWTLHVGAIVLIAVLVVKVLAYLLAL